jgi:hypothetical protein
VFVLPFFLLPSLKLRGRQKLALCGIFSLGLITIIISLTRFIKVAFPQGDNFIDDASGSKFTLTVSWPCLMNCALTICRLVVYRRDVHSNHRRFPANAETSPHAYYSSKYFQPQQERLQECRFEEV